MTADEIFEKVQDIVAEQFSVDRDEVTMDTLLEEDLSADSVDLVDLAVTLEQEFNLDETDESVLGTIKTVGDVVGYIEKQLAE
ncbi:MAG TPA: acyl carrier protein [Firmicutes bacterium]|nr:acyl carrier protein [Bacillota bacterium]